MLQLIEAHCLRHETSLSEILHLINTGLFHQENDNMRDMIRCLLLLFSPSTGNGVLYKGPSSSVTDPPAQGAVGGFVRRGGAEVAESDVGLPGPAKD